MNNISIIFEEELKSFHGELQQIVGEFDMSDNISTGKEEYEQFLSDIKQIFESKANDDSFLSILKNRTQLGLLPKVEKNWGDAIHTRYDHSVGVTAKCIVVCAYLNSKAKDDTLKLAEQEIRELALAAALHDVGHLPVSHAVERAFLSCSEYKKDDVTHEARIIPMLLGGSHPLFKNLFDKISEWNHFDKVHSIRRAAYLISEDETEKYVSKLHEFKYPKKVLQQLLSSEIDMDRLDFILRDAEKLKYAPVTLIRDKILCFIKGLSLRSTYSTRKNIENNVELCIDFDYIPYIFMFLVSRLLMYKNCYFSQEVRAFEGMLTYIVSEFLRYGPKPNSEELMEYFDEFFCYDYLMQRVDFLPDDDKVIKDKESISTQEHIRKLVQAIKENKTNRYKYLYSIDLKNPEEKIKPRLKDELELEFNNHAYINEIKEKIIKSSQNINIRRGEFLIDVFSIKEGEGNFLVSEKHEKIEEDGQGKEIKKIVEEIKLLNDYMNGSNIHRLYTKKRLDFYYKSDLSPQKIDNIKKIIENFFYVVNTKQAIQ